MVVYSACASSVVPGRHVLGCMSRNMHNKRRGNSLLGPECFHCITRHSVVINANNINELVEAYQFTSECDLTLRTLRFATTDGWTRVARCLGDWIEYGALWRVVGAKTQINN